MMGRQSFAADAYCPRRMITDRTCQPQSQGVELVHDTIKVAPRAGFEPATNRLTAGCSTAELPGNALATVASNKRGSRLQSVKSAPADFAGSGGRAGWRCPHAYARAELAVASATAALSEGPS